MKLSPCKSFPSACLGILLGATTALPLTPAQSSQSTQQFVATVSSQTGQPPTGEVQLLDGGVAIASGTLQNGHVTLAPHPLSPGPHTLTAGYSGNADYLPSVSSDLVEIVSEGRPCKGAKDGAAKNASSTSR